MTAPGFLNIDMVLTPFSYGGGKIPSAEVHATALGNLISGNAIRNTNLFLKWLTGFLILSLCFVVCLRRTEKFSFSVWLFGLFLIPAIAFTFFAILRTWIAPVSLCVSLTYVFLLSYLHRLDEAARELDARYASIIRLLGKSRKEQVQPVPSHGIRGFLSADGINSKIQRLISQEDEYDHILQGIIEERTQKLAQTLELVRDSSKEVIFRLASAGEFRDIYTGKHIVRISTYVTELCKRLNLSKDLTDQIVWASAIHDIGKIGIPDSILIKPGLLTPEEMDI